MRIAEATLSRNEFVSAMRDVHLSGDQLARAKYGFRAEAAEIPNRADCRAAVAESEQTIFWGLGSRRDRVQMLDPSGSQTSEKTVDPDVSPTR